MGEEEKQGQGQEQGKRSYAFFDAGPLSQKDEASGIAYDFNYGVRLQIPPGKHRVRLRDRDADLVVYDAEADNALVISTKKYYVNFEIEVYRQDVCVFRHAYDAKGQNVLIRFPVGALGDVIAWFPYARAFREKHGCEVYCAMREELGELFKASYPELHFIPPDERPANAYASYYMGIFFPCDDRAHQPVDWRIVGLQKTIPHILGLEVKEIRPRILPKDRTRRIKEPYVCIASQATSQAKYWNNPTGWYETVAYLKQKGYRVLCIDREHCHGDGSRWNLIPYGAENFTGNLPLQERVDLLCHADFFVGLSSGLSWLAWAAGKKVVLISGFSLPLTEFYTPYRVINYHACNGCWTDSSIEFVHEDFAWCPRHKNTDRQFECTRLITAGQVRQVIDRLLEDLRREGAAAER